MVNVEMMAENSPSPPTTEAPSPQCVGREFVRQYYTLLASAPEFVHRFYSNESIFVHGGDDEIIGQSAIAKKIAELGYSDCRTRIRVLDSHETIGKGVVVQVVGELAVKGESDTMRRFVQTFVLAPQNEKKYYVYNDIFRYEDDLFNETNEKNEESIGNDSVNAPDRSLDAHPLEQRPSRAINNGDTHPVDGYYPMMPNQQGGDFQPSVPGELVSANNPRPPVPQGYNAQPPLPQRNAASMDVPPYGSNEHPENHFESPPPPPTGPADAHQQSQYAQSSQYQAAHPTFDATLPSQSPVPPPFNSASQQPTSTMPPSATDLGRPRSGGIESPGVHDEQDQPHNASSVPSYASLAKKKPTKGPQQQGYYQHHHHMNTTVPPQQYRHPMDYSGGQGPRYNQQPPGGYPPIMPTQQWDQRQAPQQYRLPSHPGEFPAGQPSYERASPAPSGGGGNGTVRRGQWSEIPSEEGAYLNNIPYNVTDEMLKNMIEEQGISVMESPRVIVKPDKIFAFVHLVSREAATRLIDMGSLKCPDGQLIPIAPLRKMEKDQYGARSGPGTGPGYGPYGMNMRGAGGGRGGRGGPVQRGGAQGGERGGRGGNRGGNNGRIFTAGAGARGGF